MVNHSEAWSLHSMCNKRCALDAGVCVSALTEGAKKNQKKPFIIHIQWLLRGDNHNF